MGVQLAARDLSVVYTAPGGGIFPALGPLSFAIEAGSFVCLVGPSGCGKSTLVRLLAGVQSPSQGQIYLDDEALAAPSRRVGLMFQDANLMPWRTVLDNIALPLELSEVARDARYSAVYRLLPTLGLAEFAHAYPRELSGGMAQRAALGRVLIQQPDALLLDEPFGALDALTREQLSLEVLSLWSASRQTVLMVTHNIHEAVLLADRIIVLSRRPGRIIADIPVPITRPRDLDATYSGVFGAVAGEVRAAINRA